MRVTIIDCVLAMMQAMTALADVDSLNEVWIRGDWRLGAGNRILAGLWELTVPFGRPYWLMYKYQLDAAIGSHFRWVSAERDDFPYEYPGRGYYIYDLPPLVGSGELTPEFPCQRPLPLCD